MDVVSRRSPGLRSSVADGCVWESRMKTDESKGGIKVLNESKEESNSSNNNNNNGEAKKVIRNAANNGKRKAWRSESIDGSIHIGKKSSGGDEKVKELSASFDGGMIKKGTTGIKKGKREIEKSPIQGRKSRSEVTKVGSVMGIEKNKNLSELRKVKSDSAKLTSDGNVGKSVKVVGDGNEENSGALRKAKSMPENAVEECSNGGAYDEIGSDDRCEDLCVDQEEVKSVTEVHQKEDKDSGNAEDEEEFSGQEEEEEEIEGEDEGEEDEEEEELALDGEDKDIEIEKKSVETKEITVNEEETTRPIDGVVSEEKKVEEVNVELPKPNTKPSASPSPKPAVHDANEKPKPVSANNASKIPPNSVVKHTTRVHRNVANPPSPSKTSPVYKQPPPVTKRSPVYQNYAKPRSSHGYEDFPEKQSKLQNLVDLIMWRDISKSAFVFGFGTFIIISSSYTKDVNISCISVISYLGLVYLALIFLYRSIICRGYVDIENNTNYVLGEEEAVWLLKLVLPYLNEFLVNIKALFSGDPATTMKLAVLLFAMARCGSSITIWKMAKLGFFGVFTLPKVCSSYSPQLTAYGNFWIRRFRDAWDSCSHKKAVAAIIFTLIWNLCSVVARIWAVFMLFVAFRYYQRSIASDEWVENEQTPEDTRGQPIGGSRRGRGPTIVETSLKEKKAS